MRPAPRISGWVIERLKFDTTSQPSPVVTTRNKLDPMLVTMLAPEPRTRVSPASASTLRSLAEPGVPSAPAPKVANGWFDKRQRASVRSSAARYRLSLRD